jgi:lactate dehydrogenase-like 2-hydroxyacid dehydrogenase
MSATRVLVTEPEFRRAPSTFEAASGLACQPAPSDEPALARVVARHRVRYVVLGHQPYRGALYEAMPPGGLLARFGVGYDGIDLASATAAGVFCTNTPGVLDQSVAEHAMLLVAAAARRLTTIAGAMTSREWAPREGVELAGKTLAIVGYGRIGRALARIARHGYRMRVVAYRPAGGRPLPPGAFVDADAVTSELAAALSDASFVSVHIPASAANARFFDAERLGLCRPDAWIINTARGLVIDEAALFDAISSGRLGGAALDVFAQEPYVPIDPEKDLRTLDRVILTPHVGSHTADANRRMAERALANVRFAVAGDWDRLDLLNPDVRRR